MNSAWDKIVNEQLSLVKSSGLADAATVNMCFAAPDFAINEIKIYIKQKFPFVNLLSSRVMSGKGEQENIFEGQTLKELQTYSKTNDAYVLYIHSKGMLQYGSPPVNDWRQYMNYWMNDGKIVFKKLKVIKLMLLEPIGPMSFIHTSLETSGGPQQIILKLYQMF